MTVTWWWPLINILAGLLCSWTALRAHRFPLFSRRQRQFLVLLNAGIATLNYSIAVLNLYHLHILH